MNRPVLVMLLKLGASGLLLLYLFEIFGFAAILERAARLSPAFVVFCWAYYALFQLASAYRWQLLLNAKDIRIPLGRLFSFYMVGMFLSHFLPGGVGGDVVRAHDVYRQTRQGTHAILSVFLDRFTGLIGIGIISLVAVILLASRPQPPLVTAIVVATAVALLLLALLAWWRPPAPVAASDDTAGGPLGKARQLLAALRSYRDQPKALAAAIALSAVLQVFVALYYALMARALEIEIDAVYFVLFLPIITIAGLAPITVGGLGVREAAMVLLFGQVGVAGADIMAVSLTVHAVNMMLSLWGAALLLLRPVAGGRRRPD